MAFSVTFSRSTPIDISQSLAIKFDSVTTNLGDAYDPHTGIFTAPTSGVYAFFLSARVAFQHSWVSVSIVRSTTVLASIIVEGDNVVHYDKGSCAATVHLNQGDTVHVQRMGGDSHISFSFFSGLLISADL